MQFLVQFFRRSALCLFACGLGLSSTTTFAAPAQIRTQVPGFYRYALGDMEVTALYDGYVDLQTQLLKGLRSNDIQSLLARMFLEYEKGVQTAVNAYLIHTGDKLVLVDAGASGCLGPTLGHIAENVRAAGYTTEAVDAVLLTHLHPDHLCGILDSAGKQAFPNATVWASQADADYWLSETVASTMPKDSQGLFKMARDAVAPYTAAGRFRTFKNGEKAIPEVRIVSTAGHTPGHVSYLFSSKGHDLLVWGDIVHSHAVQFQHPEVSMEFDTDQAKAIATRKALFAQATKAGWAIAGAHLPFPGLGHVRKDPKGYAWVPVEFGPLREDRN